MKKLIFGLVLCLSMAMVAQAGIPITVDNQSFEAPVIAEVGDASWNWNNQDGTGVDVITGWSYDYAGTPWPSDNDIGVWHNANTASPDGTVNTSFVRHSLAAEPCQVTGPWQDLGYTIVAGETYTFMMDVRRHDAENDDHAVSLTFNYHDAGLRAEIIENLIDITGQAGDTWEKYSVSFTAEAGADYIGKSLGIEFNNESVDDSWHSFDDARVEQPYVLNFDPCDGEEGVLVTANLEWDLEGSVTNCDVYFGSDPNFINNPKVVDAQNTELYDPLGDMASETTYYWRVDARVDTTVYEGDILEFTTIAAEPQIDEDPCGLTIEAGETAVFRVKATNATGYLWKMLDAEGNGADVGTESTLTITNVQKVNEGTYWCEVSNVADMVETARVSLMTRRLVARWEFEDNLEDSEAVDGWDGVYTDPNTENPDPAVVYVLDPCSIDDGKALQLTADELHVQVTGSEGFFNFYPQGYTVNVWVKTEQIDEWGVMASKRVDGGDPGWALICDDENKAGSELYQVSNIAGTSDIADNEWHMVTATYDAETGTCSLYVDGEQENQSVDTDKAPTNDQLVVFGADDVFGAYPYAGLLDKMSIYSYSLDPVDVAMLYIDVMGGEICVGGNPDSDLTGDCKVNILDFAVLAADWLECNLVPDCLP